MNTSSTLSFSSPVKNRQETLEAAILATVFRYRCSPDACRCGAWPCAACLTPHRGKAARFVARGEPIHFVLPSFPAKSPNRTKTLGPLPDLAERLALAFLQRLCDRIAVLHEPGARITICSDGRVFSDLVNVADVDVSTYGHELRLLIAELDADSLDVFNLEDALDAGSYDGLRADLVRKYGTPLAELRDLVKAGAPQVHAFNGIARFLFEDQLVLEPGTSRSRCRTQCKERAYHMLQRSIAWGGLVQERFPNALRLSIHPQPCHSEKIGIGLVESADNWLTPWHGVALDVDGRFLLTKRYLAEELGAQIAYRAGRPSHFTISKRAYEEKQSCVLAN